MKMRAVDLSGPERALALLAAAIFAAAVAVAIAWPIVEWLIRTRKALG